MTLIESVHPKKEYNEDYNLLIGIDEQKRLLLETLELLLNKQKIADWEKKHHKKGLPVIKHLKTSSPLVILSGEVGCGKTALAQCIATPLAETLGGIQIKVFESPSNIRGSGLVGEISNRITEVFDSVKAKLRSDEVGILIIDEADDIATSRAQNQAHHEDRAGLNVLIKQIDSLRKAGKRLVVIMITNRVVVLDPAVRRRTSLHLQFDRPDKSQLEALFTWILEGTTWNSEQMDQLIQKASKEVPYSFSDIIQRVAKQALYEAVQKDVHFSVELLESVLESTEPTPLLGEQKIN